MSNVSPKTIVYTLAGALLFAAVIMFIWDSSGDSNSSTSLANGPPNGTTSVPFFTPKEKEEFGGLVPKDGKVEAIVPYYHEVCWSNGKFQVTNRTTPGGNVVTFTNVGGGDVNTDFWYLPAGERCPVY